MVALAKRKSAICAMAALPGAMAVSPAAEDAHLGHFGGILGVVETGLGRELGIAQRDVVVGRVERSIDVAGRGIGRGLLVGGLGILVLVFQVVLCVGQVVLVASIGRGQGVADAGIDIGDRLAFVGQGVV